MLKILHAGSLEAWRLELQSENGGKISDYQILIRMIGGTFSFLFFGIGYLFILFNRRKRSLHDIASKTYLKQTPLS